MAGSLEGLIAEFERHGRGESGTSGLDLSSAATDVLVPIPIDQIERDPQQPRRELGSLDELKESIRQCGLIQPIVVSVAGPELFRIIAGERRFTAMKELGCNTIRAIVRTIEEHHRLEIQLMENLHRKDLTPCEEAASYEQLINEFGLTHRQLAKRLGRSRTTISEVLALTRLSQKVRAEAGRMPDRASHSLLLEIVKAGGDAQQEDLWGRAVREGLTVEQVRRARDASRTSPPSGRPRSYRGSRRVIKLAGAVVTIQFEASQAEPSDYARVLREALGELEVPDAPELSPW